MTPEERDAAGTLLMILIAILLVWSLKPEDM